ncbi:MAG: helix-turn-helix domain-containing protein [Clostridia bacterium]|nr:helix-turn-helix domain-containing protein [Clostridia bacterium]
MNKTAKKTIIVHILKILYCYSSSDYPVTQTFIADYLNDIDIACDRKTVGRNMKYLIDMGLPIVKSQGSKRGYYYDIENDKFFIRKNIK